MALESFVAAVGKAVEVTSEAAKKAGEVIGETAEKAGEAIGEVADKAKEVTEGAFNPDKRINPNLVNETIDSSKEEYNLDKRINPDLVNEITDSSKEEYDPDKRVLNETISSDRVFKDDNGKTYRINDDLVTENEFIKDGYKYKTDSEGRITSAEGDLRIKDHVRKKNIQTQMEKIGKGDQLPADERGHLIADQFNGSGGLENLVPMDASLNRGRYNKMENTLAKSVKNGDSVYLKVEPKYDKDSYRPSSFKASYYINGEKTVMVFKNGGEMK